MVSALIFWPQVCFQQEAGAVLSVAVLSAPLKTFDNVRTPAVPVQTPWLG